MGERQVLQNGMWNAVKPPYGSKYVDVKLADKTSTSFNFSTQEEFQKWRLACLGIGFVLLFLSPIVSKWAPFSYGSFMALGVLLVVLIVLFQGMKLLPMGRKGLFYLTIYGSVLGAGSYAVRYFSTLVTSILEDFGLSEEMHNPASIFLLVVIVLTGSNGASVEDAAVIEDLLTKLETRVLPSCDILVTQWLIQWINLPPEDTTWEDADFFKSTFPEFYSQTVKYWFPEKNT